MSIYISYRKSVQTWCLLHYKLGSTVFQSMKHNSITLREPYLWCRVTNHILYNLKNPYSVQPLQNLKF